MSVDGTTATRAKGTAPGTPPAQPTQGLYKAHEKVYPKKVVGAYRRLKWILLALFVAVTYITPWIRWDRGPETPNQAVLADFANQRLFFFWIEIWPQEFYYVTGILVISAVGLFLVTALFGRVWCGYACPQTVWTDLFMVVERKIEGDRNERMRLDKQPWTGAKLRKKLLKHLAWIGISVSTGGIFITYFVDAPDLARQILSGTVPGNVLFFIALFTGFTYVMAGFAREQVCTYMCPWPRFQSAMLDEHTLVVTYHDYRGEPRGKLKAASDKKLGDCIDCLACVHVCPTGIDIRDGQQLECIGCGLCADACDDTMIKIGRPTGLIAFDTLTNVESLGAGRGPTARRWVRPRTMIYGGVLTLVLALMIGTFSSRTMVDMVVLRDRNPLFVQLADGTIRNSFTLKITNKSHSTENLVVSVAGVGAARVFGSGPGIADDGQSAPVVTAGPDAVTTVRLFVAVPPGNLKSDSNTVQLILTRPGGKLVNAYNTVFMGPGQ